MGKDDAQNLAHPAGSLALMAERSHPLKVRPRMPARLTQALHRRVSKDDAQNLAHPAGSFALKAERSHPLKVQPRMAARLTQALHRRVGKDDAQNLAHPAGSLALKAERSHPLKVRPRMAARLTSAFMDERTNKEKPRGRSLAGQSGQAGREMASLRKHAVSSRKAVPW